MKKTKTQNRINKIKKNKEKKSKKKSHLIQNINKNSNCISIIQYNCCNVLYSMQPRVLHSEHG